MNRLKTAAALLLMTAVIGGAALTGTASNPRPAEAAPTAMLGLNGGSCLPLAIAFGGLSSFEAVGSCANLQKQSGDTGSMQKLVKCLRGSDTDFDGDNNCLPIADPITLVTIIEQVTPDDIKPMDLDKNQVRDNEQYLYVFAFVDDDAPVRFITDKGTFYDFLGFPVASGQDYYCQTGSVELAPNTGDPDCDDDPATVGDGVVVAKIKVDATDDLGPGHVTAIQEGIGFPMEFTVTGNPETIQVAALFGKDTIQTGATIPPTVVSGEPELDTDCKFGASLSAVLAAIGHESKTVLIAKTLDNDGTELSGQLLLWDTPFDTETIRDQGGVTTPQMPTLDLGGSIGIGFPQFVCGGQTEGDLKMKVTFDDTVGGGKTGEYANAIVHVVGPAANIALTADPAVIDCDGVNTSKVTATVTQADGKPVANGLDVNFAVKVLGNASPLKGDAGGGTASTTVTPLRGAAQTGVPVVVTAGDVQASILVKCSGVVPPAAAGAPAGGSQGGAAAPGRPGTISGPDTGTGVAGGRGALSWWPVLGLAAAAAALLTARTALKRH